MGQLHISRSRIEIPQRVVVECALPAGYTLKDTQEYFVMLRGVEVAKVFVDAGFLVFEFYDDEASRAFRNALEDKYLSE